MPSAATAGRIDMARNKTATLYSAKEPTEEQYKRIKQVLREKMGAKELIFVYDEKITSGFKLEVDNKLYDWTVEGRLHQLTSKLNALESKKSVIPLMRKAIGDFKPLAVSEEIGTVISVRDGIAFITGLESAEYDEILVFDSGVKGIVQDLKEDRLGCILFDSDRFVSAGSKAVRTGQIAGMPVGEGFIGRVIDSLGNPVDGLGDIEEEDYLPIEKRAPGIIDRQPVNTPLETGILAIDSMFPIGRGQRELIIGDRQTGKTAIAVDTILNQKGKDVICIYVSICQKASSTAALVNKLKSCGAMEYTIVVCAPASDPAPLEFIAPYAGCTLGEYFMLQGRDVLIIYDDLSKHAVSYRTISLLLGRTPGREAYPGDIFYLHSRLLERSAHLSDELGGGSLTALPIVETLAGDVSAYIPTNVISITDGQIFLESELFLSGQRPAVNVGISVSRIGGDAQSQIMKKASGTMRLDLAQYREMAAFTQFAGDLDEDSRSKLNYGRSLMNILRQKQYSPIPRHRQVITLMTALAHKLQDIPEEKAGEYLEKIFERAEKEYAPMCEDIDKFGYFNPDYRETILSLADSTVI